jgi:hypothetical protein
LITTATVGIIKYDGVGRRVSKQVGDATTGRHEMGDWK